MKPSWSVLIVDISDVRGVGNCYASVRNGMVSGLLSGYTNGTNVYWVIEWLRPC